MSGNSVSYLSPSSMASSIQRASLLGLYVFVLAAAAVFMLVSLAFDLMSLDFPEFSVWQFFFFLVLAVSAEKATIRIGRTQVSASFLAYFLSAALLGPLPSMVIALLAQVVHLQKKQLSRNTCFAAAAALEAGFTGLIYWAFPYQLGSTPEVMVVGGLVAGIGFQLINYVLFVPVGVLRGLSGPIGIWKRGVQPFLPTTSSSSP